MAPPVQLVAPRPGLRRTRTEKHTLYKRLRSLKLRLRTLLIMCLFLPQFVVASPDLEPIQIKVMPFQAWKQEQIVRAQNEVVKLTNELLMSHSKRHQLIRQGDPANTFNHDEAGLGQKTGVSVKLQQAQQNLQIAKELEFDDYLEIHMQLVLEDKDALKDWISKLSQEELVQAIQYLAESRGGVEGLPSVDVGAMSSESDIKTN